MKYPFLQINYKKYNNVKYNNWLKITNLKNYQLLVYDSEYQI